MRVFVVIGRSQPKQIATAIESRGLASFEVDHNAWMVASDGTTREVAERLGIRNGENGTGLVCLIESYSGRLPADAWEWLKVYEAKSE